ncbi:MAG TPA: hypothetical protein PLD88_14665, partial [Candidatus Berkiella sp.]|nr:hypothetical protein [Candidatus Berkiella sp.]
EEESLLALFKVAHGLPVYTDPHQSPYTATYFNWFFYTFYGKLTTFVIHVFHLDDAWIPTIGRLITFSIVSAGFVLTYRLLRSLQQQKLAFSLSALLWYGPLIGFWSMTVRPDLLGLFFDACAAACLLHYFPQKRIPMVILAALYCYLSWSCKQINIVMPGAIGLLLLWRRQWVACVLFGLLLVSLYAATFALLSTH